MTGKDEGQRMKDKGQKKNQVELELQTLKIRVSELDSNWKRALADYKNLEARTERTVREAVLFGHKSLVFKFLKVLDDLNLAFAHHPDQPWIKLILDDLKNILTEEGIVEIEVADKQFDSGLMECVGKVAGEENLVVKVVQTGYKLHDRILRPARVEVGKGKNV